MTLIEGFVIEGFVIGWLVLLMPALCGSSCANDAYSAHYALATRLGAAALVIPVGLLVTSWALPWRRSFVVARVGTSFMTPVSLGVLYFLFVLFTSPAG